MSTFPSISIVIRAHNEAASLEKTLGILRTQDYPKDLVKIIVVDNGSTDNTAEIAATHGARIIELSQDAFNYPHSSNVGISATKNELVILISAHSFPINRNWLRSIVPHFNRPEVAGVYGPVLPHGRYSLAEWLVSFPAYWFLRCRGGTTRVNNIKIGILGATNCALRRSLWEQHPFDETWGAGGEDYAWAAWAIRQGYEIWLESGFAVRHSHHLSLWGYVAQLKHWRSLTKPKPFSRAELTFRSDLWKK